jgi:formamidopyrimidine-DNA glycosylase
VLDDGTSLLYSDVRKFGTMVLTEKGKELEHKSIAKLGPEINNSS